MYPVSDAFLKLVKDDHTVVTAVEVHKSGYFQGYLDMYVDGEVTVDKKAATRRRLTLTLTDPNGTWTPSDITSLIQPYGTELRVLRGISSPTLPGGREWVSLGIFWLDDVVVTESEGLTIQIEGFDRSYRVSRSKLENPFVFRKDYTYEGEILKCIQTVAPQIQWFGFQSAGTIPTNMIYEGGADAWAACQEQAASVGYQLYFDQYGMCVLEAEPDTSTRPAVANYIAGEEATILSAQRSISGNVPNVFVVIGENLNNPVPVRGEAADKDPGSPTNSEGPYGRVVDYEISSVVNNERHAQLMADGKLRRLGGITENINFPAIVNPAHDVDDVVYVYAPKSKTNSVYVIDQLSIPLTAQRAMNVIARKRKVTR